eukprot:TRINITY_DN3372_c0_g1_i1.p1 TRINITY_DN3372_c0_g1~~TRINITY_DN3372_c0_g1_i1.p1  ORF type:complete len:286 (-),score=47.18 TRINITY_DN3372_c0_g1_i1:20-877(-)
MTVVSFVLFLGFYQVVKLLCRTFFAKGFLPLPPRKKRVFVNTAVSLIHSFWSSLFAMFVMYRHPEIFDDMVASECKLIRFLLAVSLGYFIYDFLEMHIHDLLNNDIGMYFHHVSSIVIITCALSSCMYYPYVLSTLLMEINSIFLHGRGLWIMYGRSVNTCMFKFMLMSQYVTFLICRVFAFFLVSWHILTHYDIFHIKAFWYVSAYGSITIGILNFILLRKLIQSDRRVLGRFRRVWMLETILRWAGLDAHHRHHKKKTDASGSESEGSSSESEESEIEVSDKE